MVGAWGPRPHAPTLNPALSTAAVSFFVIMLSSTCRHTLLPFERFCSEQTVVCVVYDGMRMEVGSLSADV